MADVTIPFVVVVVVVLVVSSAAADSFYDEAPTESHVCHREETPDEFLGFDFITKFQLERRVFHEDQVIKKIVGSNKHQSAFRISTESRLRIPTRAVFPYGLPKQFSLVATVRQLEATARETWDLIRIENREGSIDFRVQMNKGRGKNELVIQAKKPNGQLQQIVFRLNHTKSLQKDFHKVAISFHEGHVELMIDCQQQGARALNSQGSIDPSGDIWLGLTDKNRTAAFDLQWFFVHCDALKPTQDKCADLKKPKSQGQKNGQTDLQNVNNVEQCRIICPTYDNITRVDPFLSLLKFISKLHE